MGESEIHSRVLFFKDRGHQLTEGKWHDPCGRKDWQHETVHLVCEACKFEYYERFRQNIDPDREIIPLVHSETYLLIPGKEKVHFTGREEAFGQFMRTNTPNCESRP